MHFSALEAFPPSPWSWSGSAYQELLTVFESRQAAQRAADARR
jgi:hypothetical protein